MSLGENIRELRKAKGLTQEALGAALGMAAQTVSKWERNDSMPDASLLSTLADTLDCTLDRLFDRHIFQYTDAVNAVKDWLLTMAGEERWRAALRLGRIVQTVAGGFWDNEQGNPSLEVFETPFNVMGICKCDEGFTFSSRKEELPYLVFFPEPESGWEPLLAEDAPTFWEALANQKVRHAAKRFYAGELPGFFDRSWALEASGEISEETLAGLIKLGAFRCIPARVDGKETELYFWTSPLNLLTILLLATDEQEKEWGFSTTKRNSPLVRKRERRSEE